MAGTVILSRTFDEEEPGEEVWFGSSMTVEWIIGALARHARHPAGAARLAQMAAWELDFLVLAAFDDEETRDIVRVFRDDFPGAVAAGLDWVPEAREHLKALSELAVRWAETVGLSPEDAPPPPPPPPRPPTASPSS
ncbi:MULTISPECIES: hypothetical protein [Actinosynnema]|uniref:hypothetical protein n=1 Tax=Actinosynnema TaxID=40566 RepID=UPI0020A609C1|nr:hypothetical protein [Actinosynnema pretiosum]MCP2096333.1 hypothetical protein [Actinosynnema pretiosum]